jgi:phage gp16-like protein
MKPVVDSEGARRADLAAIHIAKKELRWDDDMYRDVLFTVCRVRSAGELDFTGRKRFLAHLRACGWSGGTKAPAAAKKAATRPVRAPLTPTQRKLWSLWQQLADAGLVNDRTMPALVAWVKRTTGVERLEWLKPRQQDLAIEAAKQWLDRAPAAGGKA